MTESTIIGNATLLTGDVIECLQTLPADSVHCCVTSPPYWGLRDYGTATWEGGDPECDHKIGRFETPCSSKQKSNTGSAGHQAQGTCPKCGAIRHDQGIGLEPTLNEWLNRMVEVCREIRRVLRPDGTFWLNCGDAYFGGKGTSGTSKALGNAEERGWTQPRGTVVMKQRPLDMPQNGMKPKDLLMMPARLAIALQEDGWWLRSEIIWAKPNPMPESVTDRPTSAHEKIYLLTRSARYFYDADAVREDGPTYTRKAGGYAGRDGDNASRFEGTGGFGDSDVTTTGRNLRNVWTIPTQPYPEAHFATFPEALPMKCIMAGTSERGCCPECGAPWERVVETPDWYKKLDGHKMPSGTLEAGVNAGFGAKTQSCSKPVKTLGWKPTCGCDAEPVPCTVLDPFSGSATTGLVALKLSRRYIGIELNPEYQELALKRIAKEATQEKMF